MLAEENKNPGPSALDGESEERFLLTLCHSEPKWKRYSVFHWQVTGETSQYVRLLHRNYVPIDNKRLGVYESLKLDQKKDLRDTKPVKTVYTDR